MESDTTEIESTASAAAAELQTPLQSESVVGGKGEAKVEGDATPPPIKRQKIAEDVADEPQQEQKEQQEEESEEQVPQLIAVERAQSTQSSLRKFNRIPVFIVDYHNDVLEFIYRCLATRHLPLERNVLVHFDSHPDLVVARDIPASASYDKDVMLNELSIENWIMPTLYAGKTQISKPKELLKRDL